MKPAKIDAELTLCMQKSIIFAPQVGRVIAAQKSFWAEESPHFAGHDAEEISGWSKLSERVTENNRPHF